MQAEGLINNNLKSADSINKKEKKKDKVDQIDKKSDSKKKDKCNKKIDDFFLMSENKKLEREVKNNSHNEEKKQNQLKEKQISKSLFVLSFNLEIIFKLFLIFYFSIFYLSRNLQ